MITSTMTKASLWMLACSLIILWPWEAKADRVISLTSGLNGNIGIGFLDVQQSPVPNPPIQLIINHPVVIKYGSDVSGGTPTPTQYTFRITSGSTVQTNTAQNRFATPATLIFQSDEPTNDQLFIFSTLGTYSVSFNGGTSADSGTYLIRTAAAAVPEPGGLGMFIIGLAALAGMNVSYRNVSYRCKRLLRFSR